MGLHSCKHAYSVPQPAAVIHQQLVLHLPDAGGALLTPPHLIGCQGAVAPARKSGLQVIQRRQPVIW